MAVFRDDLLEAQWLRAASHTSYGGAEIGECFAAAKNIREDDPESWFGAWTGLADAVLAEGKKSSGAPARACALRAANYYRAATLFLYRAPPDPRLRETWRKHRDAFAAAELGEEMSIPYEGRSLHGWFFRGGADAAKRPTLIVNGGYDSTAEEGWLFSGAAAVARGYNALSFDGPGQGKALIEDGIVFRPDWENVIRPVVDDLVARPDVDTSRIALLGISFGGYLAPRAASGEPRLAACIADPGEYSLFEEMQSRMPGFVARNLPDGNRLVLRLLDTMLTRRLKHPTGGWGLRRGLFVHGVADPLAYLRLTADYTLEGRAANIRCPTLVCSAAEDEIGVTAKKLFDMLTCDKAFIAFLAKEGAGGHCEAGTRTLFNLRALDWLDRVLKR